MAAWCYTALILLLATSQTFWPSEAVKSLRAPPSVTLDERTQRSILSAAKQIAKYEGRRSPLLVLTLATDDHRELLVNWMANMQRINVSNYLVVCLDEGVTHFMSSIDRPCIHPLSSQQKSDIWSLRLALLPPLLRHGVDVVVSDLDAVWRQDPTEFLGKGDIVSSRGTWPVDIKDKLGSTLCMGFIYFRGVSRVAQFLEGEVLPMYDGDDQIALNRALVHRGLHFPQRLTFAESASIDEGRASDLIVELLDNKRFQRSCGDISHSFVVHCWNGGGDRVRHLMSRGLFLLEDGWKEKQLRSDAGAWLSSIIKV